MIPRTRHGLRIATLPSSTALAPASSNRPASSAERMPPPATIGTGNPEPATASRTQSSTIGNSGAPESPPPPRWARGDALPNRPSQSIQRESPGVAPSTCRPQGMVFETTIPAHAGCMAIRRATWMGTMALILGRRGTPGSREWNASSQVATSAIRSEMSWPELGQDALTSRANGARSQWPARPARRTSAKTRASSHRSLDVGDTAANDNTNGSVRACQRHSTRRSRMPGLDRPTALSTAPRQKFTRMHFGFHSFGVVPTRGMLPARRLRVTVLATKVLPVQSRPKGRRGRWNQ